MDIRTFRQSRGFTLEAFGEALGGITKGYLSQIENGATCSQAVALKIEALSGGEVNAGEICPAVMAARAPVDQTAAAA